MESVKKKKIEYTENVPENPVTMDSFFDLLNRDQRTTKTIEMSKRSNSHYEKGRLIYENCDKCTNNNFPNFREYNKPNTLKSDNVERFQIDPFPFFSEKKLKRTEKRINLRNVISRLGDVFIIGVWLLTIVKVPTTMSAPASHHSSRDELDDSTPQWMHPCGKSLEQQQQQQLENDYNLLPPKESDAEILKNMILQARITLSYAESFKEEYVRKTFDLPFQKHHETWINNQYTWLPNDETEEIPKKLGKSVKSEHLESKGFDEFLKKIYEYLQKFAVGIEQVVWDQEKSNGEFLQHFNKTEAHLRTVLCQIRTAMIERNIIPNDNVERSIMGEQFRNMKSDSYRNLRDWLIFRDYMNGLEYVIEVFEYIEKNLTT